MITSRAIRPEDAQRLERMFGRLSPTTIYRRFFTGITKPNPGRLRFLADVDHDRREAVVALHGDEIVAVARYDRDPADPARAEVAVTVEDAWQRQGLATYLLERLTARARERGIDEFTATVLSENRPVVALAKSMNPSTRVERDGPEASVVIPLRTRQRAEHHDIATAS